MTTVGKSMGTAIKALQIALFALICFFVVKALMVWLNPSSVWKAPQAAIVSGGSPVNAQSLQKSINVKFDPFHRNKPKTAVIEEPVDKGEDAPETTLNLTLTGLISGENGRVTIKNASNKQSSYGIGDEITNGVTLKSIFPEYVILSRSGKRERLTFEREDNALAEKSKPTSSTTTKTRTKTAPTIKAGMSPTELFDAIGFEEVKNNKNKTIGYKIPATPGLDIRQIGFEPGDLLVRIGGKDLSKKGVSLKQAVFEAALSGNTTAQVTRRGRRMTIRVKLP